MSNARGIMDTKKISELVEHYRSMHEEELAVLSKKQNNLVPEAKVALATVISERNIDLNKLAQEESEEIKQRIKKQEVITEKKEKRDAIFYKIMLVIGVPVCIFQLFFNPNKFFQTILSTVGAAIAIAIVLGIFHVIKKTNNK